MSRVKEWCKCRIRVTSVSQRTIIRALIRTMCLHHIGPHSHLNAFECTWALQQGGIKPKRFSLYNAACVCRQASEQRGCQRLQLAPHTAAEKKRGKEGTRSRTRMMSSLSFVSDSLLASQRSASGFRPARALRGGLRARETHGWTK